MMMELDFDDTAVRALRDYVRRVSVALGLRGECSYVQADAPKSAYIALEDRLDLFPDRDVALLWDEHDGWSAVVETHSSADLQPVAYLVHGVSPSPETVAAWAKGLFRADATLSDGDDTHDAPAKPMTAAS